MTTNTEPDTFRWIHAQTLEKSHTFSSLNEALDFYFQRISFNLITYDTMWWLELNNPPVRDSPLYSLVSYPPFQETNNYCYIPIKNIRESNILKNYHLGYGLVRAHSKPYIFGYHILHDNNCSTERYVTIEGAMKYIKDFNISSYEIHETTLGNDLGRILTKIVSSQ